MAKLNYGNDVRIIPPSGGEYGLGRNTSELSECLEMFCALIHVVTTWSLSKMYLMCVYFTVYI